MIIHPAEPLHPGSPKQICRAALDSPLRAGLAPARGRSAPQPPGNGNGNARGLGCAELSAIQTDHGKRTQLKPMSRKVDAMPQDVRLLDRLYLVVKMDTPTNQPSYFL